MAKHLLKRQVLDVDFYAHVVGTDGEKACDVFVLTLDCGHKLVEQKAAWRRYGVGDRRNCEICDLQGGMASAEALR